MYNPANLRIIITSIEGSPSAENNWRNAKVEMLLVQQLGMLFLQMLFQLKMEKILGMLGMIQMLLL